MLKNENIATLELCNPSISNTFRIDNNQPRWWIKNAILTDRGFYLFQEKGDLLGDEYGNTFVSLF